MKDNRTHAALFAFLAAVYLTVEAREPELQDDFRFRALATAVAVGVMALLVFLLSGAAHPRRPERQPVGLAAADRHRCRGGRRDLGTVDAALLPCARAGGGPGHADPMGLGAAQYSYLVEPDITIQNAAAPPITLRLLLIALGAGALLLFPSVYFLFRIFKGPDVFRVRGDVVKERSSRRASD